MTGSMDRTALLAEFGQELAAIRIASGAPSYAQLRRWSAYLPPATTSNVLSGKSNPRLDFVIWFVTGCAVAAEDAGIDIARAGHYDLDVWRARWEKLQTDLAALGRRTRRGIREALPAVGDDTSPDELRNALGDVRARLERAGANPRHRALLSMAVVHIHHLLGEHRDAVHAYNVAARDLGRKPT